MTNKNRLFVSYTNRVPIYISDFTERVIDHLRLRKYDSELEIHKVTSLEQDHYGLCYGYPDSIDVFYADTINGESIPKEYKLRTIAHEMIHVKQILKRELYNELNERFRWKGPKIKSNGSFEEYKNCPWELEAHQREEEVYLACRLSK